MEFVAIDVETANPSYASICQLGFVRYSGSELIDEWKSYTAVWHCAQLPEEPKGGRG